MGQKIKIEMGDWLFNVGIVGFVNILRHSEDVLEIKDRYVEFDIEVLEGFEDKYFRYLIDKYEETMVYSSLKNKIDMVISSNVDESNWSKEHKSEIQYIKDKLKNSAYKDIASSISLSELNKPTKIFLKSLLNALSEEKQKILKSECIGYYDQKSKMSKSPNAIVDKFINTNMLYIKKNCEDVIKYVNEDKSKYKLNCFTCGNKIKSIDKGFSFLNNIYFDTSRKTSHVWNFTSDIEICPICSFIYYCIPCGFTTIQGKGIYVNEGNRLDAAININNTIKTETLKETDANRNITYKGLVYAIHEQINSGARYDLADIQVVKYEEGRYRFNILSKNMLRIIASSEEDLNYIVKCGFKEVKTYFNVYELVIGRILDNQNLFTLIHKLLVFKLSSPADCRFSIPQLIRMLQINLRIMEGLGYMEKIEKDIIKQANTSGYYLREEYKGKGAKDKLNGISYRLLNALKTSNKNMFMDTLLNCYLYTQKTVPMIFLEALKDDEKYKTIGYAFVTGLIEGKELNKMNGGEKND